MARRWFRSGRFGLFLRKGDLNRLKGVLIGRTENLSVVGVLSSFPALRASSGYSRSVLSLTISFSMPRRRLAWIRPSSLAEAEFLGWV